MSKTLFKNINEATTSWKKMMQGVRSSETGPWSLVAIENKKVVSQKIDIKIKDMIPAHYEAMRKEFPRAKIHIEDGTGMTVWNESLELDESNKSHFQKESVNEGMTFGEIKDKFTENPYGIGADSVEFVEGKYGNSSMLIFRHEEKSSRDQIVSRLKTLGIPSKKMSKSTADKSYKYRYELILHESVLEETNEVNERNTKLYVYPSSKKDHQMISNWLERSPFHAEEDSNSFIFSVSGQRDADATERDLDKEFTKLGANARFVLEGRSQIKRKYGEYGAIRVNNEAPVRNSILEFVGKRFVTRAELDSHLIQLSEDRGKAVDQNAWFKRNERYFESFSNRGSEVWTLSKYGKRILENIIKAKQEKQENTMIKESIGLFKFNSVNESKDFALKGNLVDIDYKGNYKRFSPEEQKLSLAISDIMWMKFRRMDAKEKINVLDTLSAHIKTTGSLQEAIDVKYWSDYNDDAGVQGQSKHYSDKSKDFEDTFEDAVTEWNQEADGENMIKGAQIQKIKKLAQEFFKKAGWISVNVVQAMIAQES